MAGGDVVSHQCRVEEDKEGKESFGIVKGRKRCDLCISMAYIAVIFVAIFALVFSLTMLIVGKQEHQQANEAHRNDCIHVQNNCLILTSTIQSQPTPTPPPQYEPDAVHGQKPFHARQPIPTQPQTRAIQHSWQDTVHRQQRCSQRSELETLVQGEFHLGQTRSSKYGWVPTDPSWSFQSRPGIRTEMRSGLQDSDPQRNKTVFQFRAHEGQRACISASPGSRRCGRIGRPNGIGRSYGASPGSRRSYKRVGRIVSTPVSFGNMVDKPMQRHKSDSFLYQLGNDDGHNACQISNLVSKTGHCPPTIIIPTSLNRSTTLSLSPSSLKNLLNKPYPDLTSCGLDLSMLHVTPSYLNHHLQTATARVLEKVAEPINSSDFLSDFRHNSIRIILPKFEKDKIDKSGRRLFLEYIREMAVALGYQPTMPNSREAFSSIVDISELGFENGYEYKKIHGKYSYHTVHPNLPLSFPNNRTSLSPWAVLSFLQQSSQTKSTRPRYGLRKPQATSDVFLWGPDDGKYSDILTTLAELERERQSHVCHKKQVLSLSKIYRDGQEEWVQMPTQGSAYFSDMRTVGLLHELVNATRPDTSPDVVDIYVQTHTTQFPCPCAPKVLPYTKVIPFGHTRGSTRFWPQMASAQGLKVYLSLALVHSTRHFSASRQEGLIDHMVEAMMSKKGNNSGRPESTPSNQTITNEQLPILHLTQGLVDLILDMSPELPQSVHELQRQWTRQQRFTYWVSFFAPIIDFIYPEPTLLPELAIPPIPDASVIRYDHDTGKVTVLGRMKDAKMTREKGRSVLVYPGGDPIDDNPNETWSSAIYLTCSKGRKKKGPMLIGEVNGPGVGKIVQFEWVSSYFQCPI